MYATPRQAFAGLYTTAPYPCSYFAGYQARAEIALPADLSTPIYSRLVRDGFRRSGSFVYRSCCDRCQACVPVRIAVDAFQPNRSQRRALKRHQELQAHSVAPGVWSEEQYQLFVRYQHTRHADDKINCSARSLYHDFVLQSTVDTRLTEFRCRESGALRIVSLFDLLDDGLSAVYNFYQPDLPRASLGTWAILWQIDYCRRQRLPYLYLGYWIAEHTKMAYKTNFSALQYHHAGQWHNHPPAP